MILTIVFVLGMISLGGNNFNSIPSEIGLLKRLQHLYFGMLHLIVGNDAVVAIGGIIFVVIMCNDTDIALRYNCFTRTK